MHKYLLAALLAGVSVNAFAADLPSRKAPPSMPQVYRAPAFTWTGLYAGVNAGVGIGSLSNSNLPASNGGVYGAQIGYNQQFGQFVGGFEADVDGTGMDRKGTFGALGNKLDTGLMTTERLRAGMAIDRALIFATAGYAGINTTAGVNGLGSESVWRNGGAIGFGAEYAFTNNITAKAEYLYTGYANANYFPGTAAAETSGLSVNLFRLGLNYKF